MSSVRIVILSLVLSTAAHAATKDAGLLGRTPESAVGTSISDIWDSPAYTEQFAESYVAVSEIEPNVTDDERKELVKIFKLIQEWQKSEDDVEKTEKVQEAMKLLEEGRNEASSAVFDFTLANIHLQRDELDQAAAAYQVAVDKFTKFRRAWRNLALIHIRRNEFDKALPALTRVIQLGGGDATTFGLLGFGYSNQENHIAAEAAYRMAILLDPGTKDWKFGLARSLFKQQRFAAAGALCAQLIKQDLDNADLWLLQANAYIGLGESTRAAENYEIVDRLGRSTPDTLNLLGDIYVNEEIYELAVNAYLRALGMTPNGRPDRALRAARVMSARGAMAEAKMLANHIHEKFSFRLNDSDRKALLKLRARIAVAEGADEQQVKILEEIVELDPLDGEALILIGQYYTRIGQYEKAAFFYERAQRVEKSEADALVRHAQLLVVQRKYSEAIPLLRRAQQLKPRENIQKYLEQVERVGKGR